MAPKKNNKSKRIAEELSDPAEEKKQKKKSKSTGNENESSSVEPVETPPLNFAEDSQVIDKIIKRYVAEASLIDMRKMSRHFEKAQETIQSAELCISINSRFKVCQQRKHPAEVAAVMKRTVCVHKNYERADYHVSSVTNWEISLPNGGTEMFSCSYDGDNEGYGSHCWSCGDDCDEDCEDFEDLTACHAATWELLGLTSADNATILYRALCDCSLS